MMAGVAKIAMMALLAAQWLAIVLQSPVFTAAANLLLGASMLFGIVLLQPVTRKFVAVLIVLALVALIAGAQTGQIWEQLPKATTMISFLLSAHFLKAAIDVQPGLAALRKRFLMVDASERNGAMALVGSLLGAVLTVGVVSLLAPLVENADDATRLKAAELSVNGVATSVLWSPFTAAMGLAVALLPTAHLALIAPIGFAIAMLGLVLGSVTGEYSLHPGRMPDLLLLLSKLLLPVLFLCAAMIGFSRITGCSIIEAGVVLIAPCATAASLLMRPGRTLSQFSLLAASMGRFIDDLTLFACAIVMAGLCLTVPGMKEWMGLALGAPKPPILLVLAIVSTVALLPLAGIHMVFPATLIFTALAANVLLSPLHQVILVVFVLLAWSLGSMMGRASITLVTASRWYDIDRDRLAYGQSFRTSLCYTAGVTACLAIVYQWFPIESLS